MVIRMSTFICNYLIGKLPDQLKDKYPFAVMHYGMQILLNFMFVGMVTFILSEFLGKIVETFILFFVVAALRQLSGGIHLKTSESCILASSIILIFIPHLAGLIVKESYREYIDGISLILMFFFAPATFKVSYHKEKRNYLRMKTLTLLIIMIEMLFLKYNYLSLAFFLQSVSVVFESIRLKTVKKRGV